MNEIIVPSSTLPLPDAGVTIRPATLDDVPFIDGLQKKHAKMVGFMPNGQLVGKINAGDVLVAELNKEDLPQRHRDTEGRSDDGLASVSPCLGGHSSSSVSRERVGYVIGTDRYFKHDDIGIIYHLNVVPGKQRSFVGAALLKAQFDRSAYGCRLYCCWCAQDIEANRFWEAMGFVPLAYRAGSEKKARVHIFWQKRIREGDRETPWWYPAKTDAGALRADRIVLPIPPGVRWSDEMPVMLPGDGTNSGTGFQPVKTAHALAHGLKTRATKDAGGTPAPRGGRKKSLTDGPVLHGPRQFAPPSAKRVEAVATETEPSKPVVREKKPKAKADPAIVAKARELRDRWLEQVNAGQYVFEDAGKYDVARTLHGGPVSPSPLLPCTPDPTRLLPAA